MHNHSGIRWVRSMSSLARGAAAARHGFADASNVSSYGSTMTSEVTQRLQNPSVSSTAVLAETVVSALLAQADSGSLGSRDLISEVPDGIEWHVRRSGVRQRCRSPLKNGKRWPLRN